MFLFLYVFDNSQDGSHRECIVLTLALRVHYNSQTSKSDIKFQLIN